MLVKPGIVYGNSIHVIAGYLLAYRAGLHIETFIGVLAGIALVIASACVINNVIDRNIDAHMRRTKGRAMVTRSIPVPHAITYGVILGLMGMAILYLTTNLLTCILGVIAYVWYVAIYGYAKRTTWLSTIIGTIPGALPIMAGYTAVTNAADATAWVLFLMLVLWQLPHFYAIAIMRKDEYKEAGLPIITSKWSVPVVRVHLIVCALLYLASVVFLGLVTRAFHPAATIVLVAAVLYWMWFMIVGYSGHEERKWAKKTFLLSLVMSPALLIAAVITVVLR
jgi:protoheme IX farnesyltransferase